MMQGCLLLLLLFAVVIGFAQSLKIVRVPEHLSIAAMLFDVIDYRAIRRWILADQENAGLLTREEITLEDIFAKLLPSCSLIELAPWRCRIAVALNTLGHCNPHIHMERAPHRALSVIGEFQT
uniref:Putative membrane protein n=1 Tax=biofilter metagenome TaxID=1070537 RepID=A0A1A7GCY2_9ZZZZ